MVRKTRLNEAAHRFMTKIVEANICKPLSALYLEPYSIELIRPPFAVLAWLTWEDEVRFAACRMLKSLSEDLGRLPRQGYRAWRRILGFKKTDDAAVKINLRAPEADDLRGAHSGF